MERDLLKEHLDEQLKKKREADELRAMPTPKFEPSGPLVLSNVAPTEQQTPEAFDRWAETYGKLIAELKRSGRAKIPTEGQSVNAKTLSEHLRAIRRAIKLFHYQSAHIDHTFDMEPYSFVAIGNHVFVEPKTGKARTEVLSAAPPAIPPLLVQTSEDLQAVARVFALKDSNGREFALNFIAIYPTDDLVPELFTLFKGFKINSLMGTFEVQRI